MVVQVGKVTGREITTNRDGTEAVVLLQVEVSDADDIQTVELHRGAGVDLNPPDDSIVVLVSAGDAWQIVATINDNVTPESMDPGDYEIYASASGAKAARVNLAGNVATINEGTKSAVSFPQLQAQFDQLVSDFNALVDLYNVHQHTSAAPSSPTTPIVPPLPPGVQSTASVDAAESDTIKVP